MGRALHVSVRARVLALLPTAAVAYCRVVAIDRRPRPHTQKTITFTLLPLLAEEMANICANSSRSQPFLSFPSPRPAPVFLFTVRIHGRPQQPSNTSFLSAFADVLAFH